ncbi:MAG: GGDEF domain-containing protein [Bacillota bacterium]|nr:GGDEF domain-containing protein [Bacillota bacterium]
MGYRGRFVISIFAFVIAFIHVFYFYLTYNYTEPIQLIGLSITMAVGWSLGRHYDKAKYYSEKDPLTTVYNRRYIYQAFPKVISQVQRKKEKLSLFVVDINNFKEVNDLYGHKKGDEVLKAVAITIVENTRKDDIVVRWGGDEFLIIMPFTNEKAIQSIADRLSKKLTYSTIEETQEIGLAMGVSTYPDEGNCFDDLIRTADKKMYEYKINQRFYKGAELF